MYGVYEVCTWDDVDYRLVASFEDEKSAIQRRDFLSNEHKKKHIDPDPICYCVLSDAQYYGMMHESY